MLKLEDKLLAVVNRAGGYELLIRSPQAAVSDYIDAMDAFIGQNRYRRTRTEADCCEGCGICCHERVPLTSVDLRILKDQVGADLEWRDFFQRFALVRAFPEGVDIVLARDGDDTCIFLDSGSGLCRVYPYRPLVCRTYICTPASPAARSFRSSVINGGEDAAVLLWHVRTQEKGLVIHECEDFDPRLFAAPPESAWNRGKRYEDILLREVISHRLWKCLEGRS
jgi:hypothetical protein